MAIRIRRGNYADFDPSKMVSGEFAVCLDNGYVYITLKAGQCIRLGTADTIEDALNQAQQYLEKTKEIYDKVVIIEGQIQTQKDEIEQIYDETVEIKEEIEQSIDRVNPEFDMNWETGELMYSGSVYSFYTDDAGVLHWAID